MEALIIDALTLESAQAFRAGLSDFKTKLDESVRGRCNVEIPLTGDRELVAVLNALDKYVTERDDGPASLELDGHRYTLNPERPMAASEL